jgi:Leucine-rich repeat (LRR) protein
MSKDLEILKQLQGKFSLEYKALATNIVELTIQNQSLNTYDLQLIGKLTNLRKLRLSNNQITTVEGLESLTEIDLWLDGNDIHGKELKKLNCNSIHI